MKNARIVIVSSLFVAAFVVSFPLKSLGQNREKFIISARAGGVNVVTGRATVHARGNADWRQLTIKEDLEPGDVVRTGIDGRVEMLLNPGSYMRIGENSEFELADNSLENLEVRLIRGTAIVEVTGADDEQLLIGITTPHTRMSIVRRGLYRVNVVPGDTTELIVRKGRVVIEDSHTKVKGGNKVIFSGGGSVSIAKLEKAEKKNWDNLEGWSKDRAQMLAKANDRLSQGDLGRSLARFGDQDFDFFSFRRYAGLWFYNRNAGCFTFLPFSYGWGSPYGHSYSSFYFGGPYWPGRQIGYSPVFGNGSGGGPIGTGGGRSGGPAQPPTSLPRPILGKTQIENGPSRERIPNN
jgi:hypothetical protein